MDEDEPQHQDGHHPEDHRPQVTEQRVEGDAQPDQEEHQRIDEEGQQLPEVLQGQAGRRRGVGEADVAHHQPGGHDSQDPREVEVGLVDEQAELLGQEERAVGQGQRGRGLDEGIVDPGQEHRRDQVAEDEADGQPPGRHGDELDGGRGHRERLTTAGRLEGQAEGHHGHRVVEQRLALDQDRQPLGGAQGLEEGDDRHRIGGRDQRPEGQGRGPREAEGDVDQAADEQRPGRGTDQGEQQDRHQVGPQLGPRQVEGGLEQQRGDQEGQDQVGGDLVELDDLTGGRGPETGDDQGHRVREPQPGGHHRHRGGDGQQDHCGRLGGHHGAGLLHRQRGQRRHPVTSSYPPATQRPYGPGRPIATRRPRPAPRPELGGRTATRPGPGR